MWAILAEVAIAVASLVVGWGISESQNQQADERQAHATRIDALFQAVKDRFNLSYNQLDQLLNSMDIRLNQLTEATRGSARLSKASQILRQFVSKYPEMRETVNQVKNELTNAVNNLTSKQSTLVSQVQKRKEVSDKQVLDQIYPEINQVNTSLTNLNHKISNDDSSNDMNIQLSQKDLDEFKSPEKWNPNTKSKGFEKGKPPKPKLL